MKQTKLVLLTGAVFCVLLSCGNSSAGKDGEAIGLTEMAVQTMDSQYACYGIQGTALLRETYPFDTQYEATYLATSEAGNQPNPYSYLWPFSGTFSSVNALLEATGDEKYKTALENNVLTGLEAYFDTTRAPTGYASYINSAPPSDRFYDDNVWLGIDFTDSYELTKKEAYLSKAKLIWTFVASGMDDQLGGGIYWCEQKKESKNTCSNAPGAVFALKLFEATGDSSYFRQGKALYEWTQKHLQDSTDYLYYDNIKLNGEVDKTKYAYNSGQMMQAASLLFKLTEEESYLTDAQRLAVSCHNYFFVDYTDEAGQFFRLLRKGNSWFTAVMLRGYLELYALDDNEHFLNAFRQNLKYAWTHSRDERGLFDVDWSGKEKDKRKWLLTQAAMVEMYARLGAIEPAAE